MKNLTVAIIAAVLVHVIGFWSAAWVGVTFGGTNELGPALVLIAMAILDGVAVMTFLKLREAQERKQEREKKSGKE
ncbi:hypothetical protein FACS1894217_10860 [Clostridia bacterium]|nr:hypothetical protein FACS1894217_10860 [Clostridia bacterium]